MTASYLRLYAESMPDISFPISQEMTKMLLFIALTLLIAIIVDNVLRSFVKVPKNFDNRRSRAYVTILRKTITIITYFIAIYFISIEIGINVTPLLASAGIIGIAIGIGAKTLVEDLINGVFLLTQDSIAIGDYVKLDDAEGKIEKLGFRTIYVRGDSGELYIIPNGQVKKIINFSHHRSYMNVDFPIKADQDIDLAIKALEEALDELKKDRELSDSVFSGSGILGIEEIKDGRMILRGKIITLPALRERVARKYRYLGKKNFEKFKIALS